MRNERHSKLDFLSGVTERVKDGRWGLDEVEYLYENHSKYHLNYEDIGNMLNELFQYTYHLALEDGVMNEMEIDQLTQVQKLAMAPIPQNKMEREALKHQIRSLVKKIEVSHHLQEQVQLEAHIEEKLEEVKEPIKERVNSVYYRTPRPKLTPYNSWY